MNSAPDMMASIRQRLAVFEPIRLDLRDDGAAHVGHAGAGGGHFELTIVSERFAGQSRVARHRMVYAALGPLMNAGIHALALSTHAPTEAAARSA